MDTEFSPGKTRDVQNAVGIGGPELLAEDKPQIALPV